MAELEYRTQAANHSRAAEAARITWAGLGINLLLTAFKFVSGVVGHSQAVIADAVHTLSDCSTDVAVLVGVRYWSAPPDVRHPHGHRRIETLVTVVIAAALAAVAAGLVYGAVATFPERHVEPPGWIALAAAAVSIVSKEGLYRWTILVGKRIKSPAVIANAWHHRSDAFSSIPVVLAVAGARLVSSWWFLDHVGAIVVSVFILIAAWRIGWPALNELVDKGAPRKVREEMKRLVLDTPGVRRVHAIRTRYSGSALLVDLHILVDGGLTVRDGHEISEQVKRRLMNTPDLVDAVVHLEPDAEKDRRKKVLFLCTGNSCRSQMAEGWARHLKPDAVEPYSAGIEAGTLDPLAVRVMAEAGVDISAQRSKRADALGDVNFDCVVTVCDHAHELCPVFRGKTSVVHAGFDDPPKLAAGARTEDEALAHYRRVRDEIRAFVERLPELLAER